jgi:hypothetical protein
MTDLILRYICLISTIKTNVEAKHTGGTDHRAAWRG